MSDELVGSDYKNIFDAIKDINTFLNLAVTESLDIDGIKQLLSASYHVETLIIGLKKRNLVHIFENKLNDYLKAVGKIFFVTIQQLETCCDEVMNKILTLQPSFEITSSAIDEYLKLLSYNRFEELISKLVEFRSVFIKLSHATKHSLTSAEVQSSFLVRSWLRVIDSNENGDKEIEHIMREMFHDVNSVEVMVAILNMEKTVHNSLIQNILLKVIYSETSSSFTSSWKAFMQSKIFVNAVLNHPGLLDPILTTFEAMESRYEFDYENKLWYAKSSSDVDYNSLVKIFNDLYRLEEFHYTIKRFVRIRKVKGHTKFWDYLEEEKMT